MAEIAIQKAGAPTPEGYPKINVPVVQWGTGDAPELAEDQAPASAPEADTPEAGVVSTDAPVGPLEIEIRPASQRIDVSAIPLSDNPNDVNSMMLKAYEDRTLLVGDETSVINRASDGSYYRISENAHHAQMVADQEQELSLLSSPEQEATELEAEGAAPPAEEEDGVDRPYLPEGIKNFFAGMPYGLVEGQAHFNDLIPIGEWVTPDGRKLTTLRDGLNYLGELTGLDAKPPPKPEGSMAAEFGAAFAMFIPTMIPFVKALRIAGSGPYIADIVGGALADFATSGMTEAEGFIGMFKMLPEEADVLGIPFGELSASTATALEDFINAEPGSLIDTNFRARLFAGIPGIVFGSALTPALKGIGKLAVLAKDAGAEAGQHMVKAAKEFFADTSGSVKLPGQAAVAGEIKLTKVEQKFFDDFLGNEANRGELLEAVPSLKIENGKLSVAQQDIDALWRFVDETVTLDGPGSVPPRLKKTDFYRKIEADIFNKGMPELEKFDNQASYRMQHQARGPDEGGARLDDMTGGGEVFPDDIYGPEGLRYYGSGNNAYDRESFDIIQSVRGNPEAEVTIYRAVPEGVDTINPGDFVTLSKEYADIHAGSGYGRSGRDAGVVISKKVKVKDVFSDGNDLNEFGYFPGQVHGAKSAGATTLPPSTKWRETGKPGQEDLDLRVTMKGTSGKNKNQVGPKDIGQYWDDDYIARYGKQGDPANQVDFDRAVTNTIDEVKYQLKEVESGKGWYDQDITDTWAITEEAFPQFRIGTNQPAVINGEVINPLDLRIMATTIAAPLSFGNRPNQNFYNALKVVDVWLKTGRIPDINPATGKGWTHRPVVSESLRLIQHLVDTHGVKGTVNILTGTHTVAELRAMKRGAGIWKNSQAMSLPGNADDVKMGFMLMGPKGGPFVKNLNGIEDTTADLWFSRTWNRHFGRMVSPNLPKDALIKDAPVAAERPRMLEWNRAVAEAMGETEQDAQAILWYYEQQLFHAMGQKSAKPSKFSDGATRYRDEISGGKHGGGQRPAVQPLPANSQAKVRRANAPAARGRKRRKLGAPLNPPKAGS